MRWHDLRQTGAVLAARAGATTPELMHRLGHTTPAMAMTYQHVSQDQDLAVAAKLSELATVTELRKGKRPSRRIRGCANTHGSLGTSPD